MRHTTCAFLLLIPLAAGCGESQTRVPTSPSEAPTAAAPAPAPPATGISTMRGAVLDTAFRPIPGAFVEVLDGPNAHATASAGDNGLVLMHGSFERTTRFRASGEGHETLVETCAEPCTGFNQSIWINFYLRPLSPPAIDLAGEYTLTVTASAACATLPAESRTREFRVSLTPRTRRHNADVLGYMLDFQSEAVVDWLRQGYVGVAGNHVRAFWTAGEGDMPGLIESLGDNRYVTFTGIGAATLDPANRAALTLSFDGEITYLAVSSPLTSRGGGGAVLARESCTSSEHRLLLTR